MNLVQFQGEKIKRNFVIVIPEKTDPEFHIVGCIFQTNGEIFEVLKKCVENYFYYDHYQANKIFGDKRFRVKLSRLKGISWSKITTCERLGHGYNYINKNWIYLVKI